MNWNEFLLISEGYRSRQLEQWRQVREICFYTAAFSMSAPKNLKKSSDLWELPGDRESGLAQDEIKEALQLIRKANGV